MKLELNIWLIISILVMFIVSFFVGAYFGANYQLNNDVKNYEEYISNNCICSDRSLQIENNFNSYDGLPNINISFQ